MNALHAVMYCTVLVFIAVRACHCRTCRYLPSYMMVARLSGISVVGLQLKLHVMTSGEDDIDPREPKVCRRCSPHCFKLGHIPNGDDRQLPISRAE